MPRHAFRFSPHVRQALKDHVERAINRINPSRFRQEADYTSALVSTLEGIVYDQADGYIEIQSTVAASRGRGAAEAWSGADVAITATISNGRYRIKKAILIQAKLGEVNTMTPSTKAELLEQIGKMKRLTYSPKVMEIVEEDRRRRPKIVSGNKILEGAGYKSYNLADYFVMRVLTTLDGDTRPDFVSGVQDSGLFQLRIQARSIL